MPTFPHRSAALAGVCCAAFSVLLSACNKDSNATVIQGVETRPAQPSVQEAPVPTQTVSSAQLQDDGPVKKNDAPATRPEDPATLAPVRAGAPADNAVAGKPPLIATRSPYGQNAKDYVLVFADEFDSFNSNLWNEAIWYEKPHPVRNFAVENGRLKIWPQRDANGKFFNRTLDTDGKYYQTYGYFEMEARLPKGRGTWPAFWLFNHIGDRRPEIDIMEAYAGGKGWGFKDKNGVHRPNVYAPTIWLDKDQEVAQKMIQTGTDLSEGFHKYAVKWEPHRQTFYFDGKEVLKVNVSMGDPMYILLDLWFGSASGEPDESTPEGKSNAYEINYVRAWKFRSQMD